MALLLLLLGLGPTAPAAASPHACTAPASRAEAWTPEQARRRREVRSDSLWLIKQVRERYAERLAAAYVEVGQGPDVRLVFRVTGEAPLPPMRLAGRARNVPVVVRYNAPHSLKEVEAIRARVQARTVQLLPTLQGIGYDEEDGAIHLDIHAADQAAAAKAFARCAELSALYGMPVRIQPNAGQLSLQ